MNRAALISALDDRRDPWDVVVIGGGATGLGAGVDAASRGYATLVIEQHDFAKGTSSRSTKLIHGGVRYLAQGRLGLVRHAQRERQLLLQNAPHLVHDLAFLVPAYSFWELPAYFLGLKAYDLLAGRFGRGASRLVSRNETLQRAPALIPTSLRGGLLYHDSQFDDARLAITLARTLVNLGGTAINYLRVSALLKSCGKVYGVRVCDLETGREFEVSARVVVNAAGVFADQVLQMDHPPERRLISPSQGIHVVLDRQALGGDCAVVVPHTDDRRILFAIPWHGKVLVGTTDTPVPEPALEPRPLEEELNFLLENAARYLTTMPDRSQILSVFAGLRPLVAGRARQRSASVSRDHHIEVAESGLVTIVGGKWTTYRHMAEDTINKAAEVASLPSSPTRTRELPLHGWTANGHDADWLSVYGTDKNGIRDLIVLEPALAEKLHPRLPYLKAEVVWAARHEMARTVEDVLSRRTRALLLDARASIEAAPATAELLAAELVRGVDWAHAQIAEYTALARNYLPS
jgi:glycerol-3-phosphate dehydrogenase